MIMRLTRRTSTMMTYPPTTPKAEVVEIQIAPPITPPPVR